MSKLMIALGGMMPEMARERSCPDCGMPMESNGCCSECGYGEEDDTSEDSSEDKIEIQTLLDTKKALQTAMELVDRMIVNCD